MTVPATRTILVSALSTAIAGPMVRSWLRSRQVLDIPNERSSHSAPTPRGGGLACAVGALTTAGACGISPYPLSPEWLGASALLGTVGRADDIYGLPALPRLSSQVAAGAAVGARAGGPTGAAFGAIALPALVNAFNFMDGINGISGGTSAVWGIAVATNPVLTPTLRMQGAVTAGMGLGFLPYNVPEASMFLGDVGSYLLGGGIAVTAIQAGVNEGGMQRAGLAAALAPMVPYLADTGSTLLKRLAQGQKVTEAHREHAYQRLLITSEWPHWAVASLVAGFSAASAFVSRGRHGTPIVLALSTTYLMSPSVVRFIRDQH